MIGLDLYFKKLTNNTYKYIFYPWGPLSEGFLVDNDIKKVLEEFNKIYLGILSIVLMVLFVIHEDVFILNTPITTVFFIGLISEVIIRRFIIIKCKRTNLRISFKERKVMLLEEHGQVKAICFLIYSAIFLYLSIDFIFKFKLNNFALTLTITATIYYLMSFINNIILIKAAYSE